MRRIFVVLTILATVWVGFAGYEPGDAAIRLDDANPSLRYEGDVTTPDAWVWGDPVDIGTWTDVWQLEVDTAASCDALIRIEWFDSYATQDIFQVIVDGADQGVNPADGTGSTELYLVDGPHTVVVDWLFYKTDQEQIPGGSYYDITFDIVGCDNWGEITGPDEGEILLTGDTLVLGFDYYDDDYDHARWAVRQSASASCSGGTVVGNVDGYADDYAWDGETFAASFDTTGWATGDYCFVVNPANESTENQVREVLHFRIADGQINGGGQIIEPNGPKNSDAYKVSFGGELWRFGSSVECDWTVQFHNVSVEDVTGGKFKGSLCTVPGDFPTGGADGVTNFAVYGSFNGVTGYTVIIRMEDFTEPGAEDTIRFELLEDPGMTATPGNSLGRVAIYDTSDKAPASHAGQDFVSGSDNSGSARTLLDRGNLQIDLR